MPENNTELPSVRDFLLTTPLYEEFEFDSNDSEAIEKIQTLGYFRGTLDAYCIWCQQDSVFINHAFQDSGNKMAVLRFNMGFTSVFKCIRDADHRIFFNFTLINNTIAKTGQFPSIADFQSGELEKYRKVLGKQRYSELTRAVGLVSHGVGVGSFVYLRRIFEGLIEEAHQRAAQEQGWDEQSYSRARMDEKIALLEHNLPAFLTENKGIYSILSKGIHYTGN